MRPSQEVSDRPMVLCVDASDVVRTVLRRMLTDAGFNVAEADNGLAALTMIAECDALPDAVIIDVTLPGLSGFDVVGRIRTVLNEHTLPVIMTSSNMHNQTLVGGLAAGCNDYVNKPPRPEELVARIRTQMRLRRIVRLNEEARAWTDPPVRVRVGSGARPLATRVRMKGGAAPPWRASAVGPPSLGPLHVWEGACVWEERGWRRFCGCAERRGSGCGAERGAAAGARAGGAAAPHASGQHHRPHGPRRDDRGRVPLRDGAVH